MSRLLIIFCVVIFSTIFILLIKKEIKKLNKKKLTKLDIQEQLKPLGQY